MLYDALRQVCPDTLGGHLAVRGQKPGEDELLGQQGLAPAWALPLPDNPPRPEPGLDSNPV